MRCRLCFSYVVCNVILCMYIRITEHIIILASVSFWPLLIIESVARVSQHVLYTHELLVKQV